TVVPGIQFGGSAVRDEDPAGGRDIYGGQARLGLTRFVEAIGELAVSDSSGRRGEAERVELRHHSAHLDGRAWGLWSDTDFRNPSSGFGTGRRELGASGRTSLDSKTSLFGQGLRTEDQINGGRRDGWMAGIDRRLASRLKLEVAYRFARETPLPASAATIGATPNETQALRGRIDGGMPGVPRLNLYGEYEQDLQKDDQHRAAVGGEFKVADRVKLYGRTELLSSFAGPYALNGVQEQASTVVGISADGLHDTRVFSEYRARDAFNGRETQAAIGLNNHWTPSPGVGLETSFERLTILEGQGAGDATAVAGAVEFTGSPLWKGSARVEYRTATGNDRWFGTLGYAQKLSRDWTLLGRSAVTLLPDQDRTDERSQLGLAFRQTDVNHWNALMRYTHHLEDDQSVGGPAARTEAHVVSTHVNVQPSRPWLVESQLAAKWARDDRDGFDTHTNLQLAGGRILYDLTSRWDVGASARGLFSRDAASRQYGVGGELGRVLAPNLRVAVGYNLFGFRDQDLAGEAYTDQGPYFHFGFKFDESMFGFGPSRTGGTTGHTGKGN
ncbi:MAG TPA: hypothetical protein VEL02_14590, partial [Jatrophihabitantaceae bacterium]|nr:hypothetical protein [Jatrophihabitantaceae bacterium]